MPNAQFVVLGFGIKNDNLPGPSTQNARDTQTNPVDSQARVDHVCSCLWGVYGFDPVEQKRENCPGWTT